MSPENSFHANVERAEGWWIIQLEEEPGLLTQTRRLDQVQDAVRDALTLFPELTEHPESSVVEVVLMGDYEVLQEHQRAQAAAKAAQRRANETAAATSRALHESGLSYRDVGHLMGITHGRAQQLASQ